MLPPLVTGLIGGVLCCSRLLAARRPPKRQALTRIAPEVLQSGGSSLSTASATADTVSLVSFNTLVRPRCLEVVVCRASRRPEQAASAACLVRLLSTPQAGSSRAAKAPLPPPPPPQRQADCNAWGLDHSAPELLAWHYRWPRIAAALKAADADVVCLQDVDTARWGAGSGREGMVQPGEGYSVGVQEHLATARPWHPHHPTRLGDLESWATGHGYEVASQEAALGRNVLIVTLFKARRFSLWWADRRRARAVCCALLYQDSAGHTQVGGEGS